MGFEFYDFVVQYRYGRLNLDRTGQLAFADALFLRTPEWVVKNFKSKKIGKRKVKSYINICNVYGKSDLVKVVNELLINDSQYI